MRNNYEPATWKRRTGRVAALLVGLVFLLASLSKIGDLETFQKALTGYHYIPFWLQSAAVVLIPGIELVVGACLVAGRYQGEAAVLATLLFLGFLALGIYNQLTGTGQSSCGCFKIPMPIWLELNGWGIVWRNMAFIAVAIMTILWSRKKQKWSLPC